MNLKYLLPTSIFCLTTTALLAQAPTDFVERPAIYKVTKDVISPDLKAFTVTGPAFGNTLKREGKGNFEPATFRSKYEAQQDSQDRIYDDGSGAIHYYDIFQSGYLDGAEVRVYRMENGKIKLVREDVVVPGGTVIEQWEYNRRAVIPADTTTGQFKWADWSRPGSERWFTVFAVDKYGNVSETATPLKFEQRVPEKGSKEVNKTENFRAQRNGDTEAPAAPKNFSGGYNAQGVLEFTWDAVKDDDLAGYYLARTDTDPSQHRGVYLQLEGQSSTPVKKGDTVIVSKILVDFTTDWLSNRVGNLEREIRKFAPYGVPNAVVLQPEQERTWRLVKHSDDTKVENPGEYFFEITLEEGETQLIGQSGIPDMSNSQQDFYPVPEDGKEYIMDVWIKADKPSRAPVIFTWEGDQNIGGFVGEHPLEVTDQWQKFSVRFTGQSSERGNHAYIVLKTTGPGTYSFDNFHIYNTDAEYLDYLPYQYENLKNSGMSAFRTHGPIKTGFQSYSMQQYLGKAGMAEGVEDGNTLPQALEIMEKSGVDPWLQIEFHMSPEEWLAFMEYMAAPYDPAKDSKASKPYAALRYAQGHQEPWMDSFETIYFELSNETWNRLFAPWTFSDMTDAATGEKYNRGKVYAKFHDYVVEILRSSPYWKPEYEDTFVHVLGGWATSLNDSSDERGYTQEILLGTETGELVTIAAYNGGWDEGEGPPKENAASYYNVLNQVNQTAIPRIIRLNEVTENASERLGRSIGFGTYEAGPGYAMNGLNNARVTREEQEAQENVMKSKLAGVATLDSFLARAKYGSTIDNFFTFAEGDYWKSHAKKYRGGQPHASFLPLVLFNQYATGDMLYVEMLSTPTADAEGSRRRQSVDDGPLSTVYATREGQRVSVFCINRMVPGYPDPNSTGIIPFGVELPFNQASSITLYRLSGNHTDHNINEEKVKMESVPVDPSALRSNGQFVVSPATGSTANGMPPAEVYLYVFEGTNIGAEGRTLSQEELRQQSNSFVAKDR